MKRHSISIYFLAGILMAAHAQKSRNDWTEMDLVGKVKYMEECKYLAREEKGTISKGKKIIDDWHEFDEHYFFDKSGKVKKEEDYQDNKLLYYVTTYAYGEDGKKLRKETKAIVKNRSSYSTYTYDKAGNEVGIHIYYSDSTTETYFMAYDKSGNLRYSEYYIDSTRYEKFVLTYNEKNQLIEEQNFFGEWQETPEISSYVYDEKGNLTEIWVKGSRPKHYTYTYNEKNQKIEFRSFDDLNQGKDNVIIVYEYDEYGHVIMQVSKYPTIKIDEATVYTYDKKKNWIQKISYKNNKPVSITERKIKYY